MRALRPEMPLQDHCGTQLTARNMTDLAADKPVKMKKVFSLLLALCMLTGLAACSAPVRRSRTYTDVFDTVTEFTVYGGTDEAFERAAGAVHGELLRLHRLFDCHRAYEGVVNLYSLNHAGGETLEIDPDLEAILRLGLEFAEATGGSAICFGKEPDRRFFRKHCCDRHYKSERDDHCMGPPHRHAGL